MELLTKLLTYRLKLVFITVICGLSLILLYLFKLQIALANDFNKLSIQNFLRYEFIASPRGNIVDHNGNLIATNKPINTIYWRGTGFKKLSPEQVGLYNFICQILNLNNEILDEIITAEKKGQKILLSNDISFEQLSKIIEQFPNNNNLTIQTCFKRHYPYKMVASHIVGYLSLDLETSGKMGLELICDDSLKGQSGQIMTTINSVGRHLESQEIRKALAGQTITTTLDLPLQLEAERIFPETMAGAFILMDCQTGSIEVFVSKPNFDPNIFLDPISETEWKILQEKKCFINRAINACYQPASIFKFITLAAAIDTKIIDQNTTWDCCGHIDFAGRAYHCKNRSGHGVVDTHQAFLYSCNIPFYEIGKKIKIDTLAQFAKQFGLGEKTGFIFKEKTGLIPTSQWKKMTKGERWWPGETLSAAIGQSFLLVTPLQIACMMTAICSGYLTKPRILTEQAISKQPLISNSNTLNFLKKCMKSVIHQGTARSLVSLKNFEIFGKTGTAQTSDVSKCTLGKEYLEHAWFASFFRYKNNPYKALVIFVENVGTSAVATNMAYNFFRAYENICSI